MEWNNKPHQRGLPSNIGAQQARFLDTMGAPSLRHVSADGKTIAIKNNGRLSVEHKDDPQPVLELSRLCWLPEGIVLTPRTAANQKGWGLPPTPDGKGTPGGDFPYVLLNQYEHNNTPTYLHSVYSSPSFFESQYTHLNLVWPVNYINFDLGERKTIFGSKQNDDAGAFYFGKYLPQFIARYVPLLAERRQATWFCHRPKPIELPTQDAKDIFDGINNVRIANGLPELSPPLEGWTTDLAQAVVLVNVLGKEQAHNSVGFTNGWQTIEQRFRKRDGQAIDSFGENMFVSASKTNIAVETIDGWVNSPPHFDVMTTDYTGGRRPGYESAGLGQLMAEVASIGYWKSAAYDDSFGKRKGRETSAVLRSLSPRGNRATTYQNPALGSVSINASPSLLTFFGLRNVSWGGKYVFSYKQTDTIAVVNDIDSFNTHRQMLVGAGLCIKQGVRRMTDEEFNLLLLRKRQHDTNYNAKRVGKNLPVDVAIVGAENSLTPAMTGWEIEARCLVYEEVGLPYKAPDTSDTTCYLVLRAGKAEDYLETAAEIARYTLPFNPATISATALFSEDGSKCVYTVGELTTGSGAEKEVWHGEKLHFYEASSDGIVEIGTAEIGIEVVSPYPLAGEYKHTINEQCHLMPYYNGNSLKWVDVKVNSIGWKNGVTNTAKRDLHASLIIDGYEWPYVDTNSGGEHGSADTAVSGTVKHLLTFDPVHTNKTHWIEYTITANSANTSKVSASVMRDMGNPTVVRTLYSDVVVSCSSDGRVWLVPMYSNKSPSSPAGTIQELHPQLRWTEEASTDCKAAFSLGGGALSNPAGKSYVYGVSGRPKSTPIAPVSFSQSAGHADTISEGSTQNGFVVGGRLFSQPFGYGLGGRPLGDDDYFKSSNLDLEQLTGVAGLSENILPLWSL